MRGPRRRSLPKGTKFVGIIAEDVSDVSVLNHLIGKLAKSNFKIRYFAGGGCGKIIGKCRAWAQNLKEQGCSCLFLVHDLDTARLNQLRNAIEAALGQSPIEPHVIIIPVREIEAWLLADEKAINKAMKLKRVLSRIVNPEGIQRPKERLGTIVYINSGHSKRYVNTIHNPQIAAECAPANLRRCPSFVPFSTFVSTHI